MPLAPTHRSYRFARQLACSANHQYLILFIKVTPFTLAKESKRPMRLNTINEPPPPKKKNALCNIEEHLQFRALLVVALVRQKVSNPTLNMMTTCFCAEPQESRCVSSRLRRSCSCVMMAVGLA